MRPEKIEAEARKFEFEAEAKIFCEAKMHMMPRPQCLMRHQNIYHFHITSTTNRHQSRQN